jgi:transcriptional regulator with PAS, ATPase and Fis domain
VFLPSYKKAAVAPLLADMLPHLMNYSWPGNVRELLNFTQRLTFFLDDYNCGDSGVELLKIIAPDIVTYTDSATAGSSLREQVAAQEEILISKVLDQSTTIAAAAAQLGIGKTTLWRKIQKIQKQK